MYGEEIFFEHCKFYETPISSKDPSFRFLPCILLLYPPFLFRIQPRYRAYCVTAPSVPPLAASTSGLQSRLRLGFGSKMQSRLGVATAPPPREGRQPASRARQPPSGPAVRSSEALAGWPRLVDANRRSFHGDF